MQARLFVLMAVGKKASHQVNHKIGRAAVTRMLNLRNVLELVNDGFNNSSFAEQELVRKVHETIFHVFAQLGDEQQSLFKEQVCQGSGNVAAIPKQLAMQSFRQSWNQCAIIDIARSQTTGKQFSAIIDSQ